MTDIRRFGLILALALLMMLACALTGCTLARDAGADAARGGIEAARSWWTTEGKALAEEKAKSLATDAKDAAIAAAEVRREDLRKKIEAGEGTTADKLLYAILAFAGGGGLGGIFMHKSSGAGKKPTT